MTDKYKYKYILNRVKRKKFQTKEAQVLSDALRRAVILYLANFRFHHYPDLNFETSNTIKALLKLKESADRGSR